MPLSHRLAIWNNKGGVGKSTICYHVASLYAESHPDAKVLVIDLCPQANVSMMLLGGQEGVDRLYSLSRQPLPRTVAGYLSLALGPGTNAGADAFVYAVTKHNPKMPENLYLMPGDPKLEHMAPAITARASQAPMLAEDDPWVRVHTVLREAIDRMVEDDGADWAIFIDTNPSFGVYTEIAVCSADGLIVPVNADDSSRVGIELMFQLLYGHRRSRAGWAEHTFSYRAHRGRVRLPQVHLLVGNRLSHYGAGAGKPSRAYRAMSEATARMLYEEYQQNPDFFVSRGVPQGDEEAFYEAYLAFLRDFATAGVIATHEGVTLAGLRTGPHTVFSEEVSLNRAQIDHARDAVRDLLAKLETTLPDDPLAPRDDA